MTRKAQAAGPVNQRPEARLIELAERFNQSTRVSVGETTTWRTREAQAPRSERIVGDVPGRDQDVLRDRRPRLARSLQPGDIVIGSGMQMSERQGRILSHKARKELF